MIVCHCAGVSDGMIRQMIRDGASSVADIGKRSGAGLCCAPCRREIAAMVADSSGGRPRIESSCELACEA